MFHISGRTVLGLYIHEQVDILYRPGHIGRSTRVTRQCHGSRCGLTGIYVQCHARRLGPEGWLIVAAGNPHVRTEQCGRALSRTKRNVCLATVIRNGTVVQGLEQGTAFAYRNGTERRRHEYGMAIDFLAEFIDDVFPVFLKTAFKNRICSCDRNVSLRKDVMRG